MFCGEDFSLCDVLEPRPIRQAHFSRGLTLPATKKGVKIRNWVERVKGRVQDKERRTQGRDGGEYPF